MAGGVFLHYRLLEGLGPGYVGPTTYFFCAPGDVDDSRMEMGFYVGIMFWTVLTALNRMPMSFGSTRNVDSDSYAWSCGHRYVQGDKTANSSTSMHTGIHVQ